MRTPNVTLHLQHLLSVTGQDRVFSLSFSPLAFLCASFLDIRYSSLTGHLASWPSLLDHFSAHRLCSSYVLTFSISVPPDNRFVGWHFFAVVNFSR